MTKSKKVYRRIYAEEEDYSWSAGERVATPAAGANKTAFRFFFMVVECFVPQKFLKPSKKTISKTTAKTTEKQELNVRYS